MTAALPAPELREAALDPHLAVDPQNPQRIVVAAAYGAPPDSTHGIWTWTTSNGGKEWIGTTMPIPRASAKHATGARVAFDGTGRALLTFAFADSASRGGAAIASSGRRDLQLGPARRLIPDRIDEAGASVATPSLGYDGSALSPLRGSVYLAWRYASTDSSALWVASTRNVSAPWREGSRVLDGLAGAIATRSDGALEVIVLDRSGRRLVRTSSTDGGLSFAHPDPVATRPDSVRIHHLVATVAPGDTSLVCWNETAAARPSRRASWCARGSEGGWSAPVAIADPDRPGDVVETIAVASGAGGLWLLTWRADSTSMEVELQRSTDGGRTFQRFAVVGARPFGVSAICFSGDQSCTHAADRFHPGTGGGLVAAGDRIFAAYLLPDGDRPDGRPTVFFTAARP